MKPTEIIISIRFKMPLWDCIKLRISGLNNVIDTIDQVGQVSKIKMK